MKFDIIELKRKRLGSLHLCPELVLVRFESGDIKWFDTYDIKETSLFFYKLFENIRNYLKRSNALLKRKALFTTTFDITNAFSYQNYEKLLEAKP